MIWYSANPTTIGIFIIAVLKGAIFLIIVALMTGLILMTAGVPFAFRIS